MDNTTEDSAQKSNSTALPKSTNKSLNKFAISSKTWRTAYDTVRDSPGTLVTDLPQSLGILALSPIIVAVGVALMPFADEASDWLVKSPVLAGDAIFLGVRAGQEIKKFELGRLGEAWEKGKDGKRINARQSRFIKDIIETASKLSTNTAECPSDLAAALQLKVQNQSKIEDF